MQIPKGPFRSQTKKTRLEKANLMPTVQAAIGRFLAVAVAFATQAPPLLPIPKAPLNCEGENIENNQSDMPGDFDYLSLNPYFRMRRMR